MMPFALGTREFVGHVCLGSRTTRTVRRVFGRVADIVVRAPIVVFRRFFAFWRVHLHGRRHSSDNTADYRRLGHRVLVDPRARARRDRLRAVRGVVFECDAGLGVRTTRTADFGAPVDQPRDGLEVDGPAQASPPPPPSM